MSVTSAKQVLNRITVLALLAGSVTSIAGAESKLFLISGTTSNYGPESYAVVLYALSAAGSLELVREIAPQSQGLFSVEADPEGDLVVAFPHGNPDSVSIVKRKDPSKKYRGRFNPKSYPVIGSEVSLVCGGDRHVSELFPLNDKDQGLEAVDLDASGSTLPVRNADPSEYKNICFSGIAGGPEVEFTPVGRIRSLLLTMEVKDAEVAIDSLPAKLMSAFEGFQIGVVAANTQYMVLSIPRSVEDLESGGVLKLYVHRRVENAWQTLEVPGNVSRSHLFGVWLASIEQSWHSENKGNPGRDQESADARRAYASGWGRNAMIPGILLLDNLQDGTRIIINTGHEDSEILDVEHGSVLLRIDDSIYEAKITGAGISAKKLIVTSPLVEGMHWALRSSN